ncbi:MAG: YbaB/EbfC family nucleoid-associated protein [Candidatus Yanofskybacteria bacterium]|nr:YbaB/EbfC family nucleoid-associated protein [Candidatus Yanofskybacteria bacterium]
MFEKLQQLKQIRELQKTLESDRREAEQNGVKVIITGSFEIVSVKLNPELSLEDQEQAVRGAYNQARKDIQSSLAQRFGAGLR